MPAFQRRLQPQASVSDDQLRAVKAAGYSDAQITESHLRELLEQGFEVAVVRDATAAAMIPDGDGYMAAITNFWFIANAVWTTAEAVERMKAIS